MWHSHEYPPDTAEGTWSDKVIVVTNLENVHEISYYCGHDGGCWQRPSTFEEGEEVYLWTSKTKDKVIVMFNRKQYFKVSFWLTLICIIILFFLFGCATKQTIEQKKDVIVIGVNFSVLGPAKDIEKLIALYDIEKINKETASVVGIPVKFALIVILSYRDYEERLKNTPCEKSDACYSKGVVVLRSGVNSNYEYFIRHELGHF